MNPEPSAEEDAPTYSEFHLGNFAYASVCTLCGALVPLSRYWQGRHTEWHTSPDRPNE